MPNKPTCKLTGVDGNVFAIIGTVKRTLERAGLRDEARAFSAQAMQSASYDDVLALCFDFVDVV